MDFLNFDHVVSSDTIEEYNAKYKEFKRLVKSICVNLVTVHKAAYLDIDDRSSSQDYLWITIRYDNVSIGILDDIKLACNMFLFPYKLDKFEIVSISRQRSHLSDVPDQAQISLILPLVECIRLFPEHPQVIDWKRKLKVKE